MTSPKLAVEQPDGSRLYVHPITCEKAPSVTTIMKEGIAKPFLTKAATGLSGKYAAENWAELSELHPDNRVEMIRYASEREWGIARDMGTKVHAAIEAWQKGEPHPASKETAPYLNSFISFMMDKQPEFLESEVTVWSRRHQYAGTFDWIARIGGKLTLGDTKTGKRVREEVGMQLAALAHADFILRDDGTEEPIPDFDGLAALHIRPRSWHLYEIEKDEENFAAFLACRELHSWIYETSGHVLRKVA